jgi:hypothetical protein
MIGIGKSLFKSNVKAVSGAALDPSAQAFITAAGITDATQQSAVNQLVLDLKSANIWTKMKAIYPIVGGSASTHKWNLKDPRDLDAGFRLTFTTGWTHSSTGMKPNGTSAYANTNFIPLNQYVDSSSCHISYYSRTDNNSNTDMGCNSVSAGTYIYIKLSNVTYIRNNTSGAGTESNTSNTSGTGFYINNRTSLTVQKIIKNTTITSFSVNATTRPNVNMYIGALNNPILDYGNKECAFASIGDGLTDSEASNLYTAVNTYQTTLNRQVP